MDNPLHNIDKLFRNLLEPTEETPSEKVWNNINKKLDDQKRKKPTTAFWWPKTTVLLLLFIGLGFGGYQLYHQKKLDNNSKNKALSKQNNLQLPINNDSLKKENLNKEKKAEINNKIINKAEVDSNLKDDKIKSKNIITSLNKKRISYTKKEPPLHAINKHEIANNKIAIKPKFDNRKTIVATDNKTLKLNLLKNKKTKNNLTNDKDIINGKVDNLTNNDLYFNKMDFSNANKTNKSIIGIIDFNLNPDLKNDEQKILNTKKADCELNDERMLPSSIISDLLNLETAHVPFLQLTNNSATKKTAVKNPPLISKSRFYISAFAAPEWQGFQLQDNDDQQNNGIQNRGGDTKTKIMHREDEDASLVTGIGLGYHLSKKLSFETGLRYSEYRIKTDSIKLFAAANNSTGTIGYKINTSLGYGYLNNTNNPPAMGDSMTIQNLQQSVTYVTMPVLLRYQVGKGRLSFNPALGFMFNFILGSSIHTNIDNGQRQMINLQGLKKVSVGMLVSPSIYYRINSHISFGLDPYLNYTISPINKATVVDSYPYGIGLGATVRYQF